MGSGSSSLIGKSGTCDSISNIFGDEFFLPIGGILSCICYLYIFYLYFVKKPAVLMRHPTTIAVYKCVFEFVFVQQYIWEPFLPNSIYYTSNINDPSCDSSAFAGFLAFMSQFSLLGGELVFFVITMDLHLAYTSPFSAFSQYKYYYLAIVLGVSLITAFVLIDFGPSAYGVASEGVVWIQDRKGQENFIKILLFYDFMAVVYGYCIITAIVLFIKMKQGFAKTLEVRLAILKRSLTYIVGYSWFWIIFFSLQFSSFLLNANDNVGTADNLSSAAAYCFAFRGLWSLTVIIATNWNDLRWSDLELSRNLDDLAEDAIILAVEEGISMKPHLNSALRAEILYFTTQGIIFSAQQYYKLRDSIRGAGRGSGSDNDLSADDVRESSFSFKDKLNLGVMSDLMSSLSSIGMGSLTNSASMSMGQGIGNPSIVTPSARQSSMHSGSVTVDRNVVSAPNPALRDSLISNQSDPLALLQQKMEAQFGQVNKSMHVEIEKEIDELGLLRSRSFREFLDKQSHEEELGKSSAKSFAMRETNSKKRSIIEDTGINSPFYAHEEMERELREQALRDEQNAIERGSGRSTGTGSSGSTIKWRDTSDLQFRMVHGREASTANSDGVTPESRWERMSSNKKTSQDLNISVVVSTDTIGSSAFHRLKNSIFEAWHKTTGAALAAVGGVYDDFTFTDYSPRLFAAVREYCNIDPDLYVKSFVNTANENFTEGRSGAFMFSSVDSKFIVKTTTREELQKLLKIMPKYIKYLRNNPYTLIIKFLGAHCITMYSTKIYFLVMLNVFPKEKMSEKYDLKGSWVNRSGKVTGSYLTRRERMKMRKSARSAPLLMDNDLQQKISIQEDIATALQKQISLDSKFLQSMNLMDYSLLIGVVNRDFEIVARSYPSARDADGNPANNGNSEAIGKPDPAGRPSRYSTRRSSIGLADTFMKDDDGGMAAEVVHAPGTYYFGIIDILQEWNFKKKLERFYKIYFRMNNPEGISATDPERYQRRFMRRVANDIFETSMETRSKSRTDTNSCCIMSDTPRNSAYEEADADIYY